MKKYIIALAISLFFGIGCMQITLAASAHAYRGFDSSLLAQLIGLIVLNPMNNRNEQAIPQSKKEECKKNNQVFCSKANDTTGGMCCKRFIKCNKSKGECILPTCKKNYFFCHKPDDKSGEGECCRSMEGVATCIPILGQCVGPQK
ncbi:MAG: hypothetical protein EXS60_00670 [Candidatus Pacebacteria bacterium]|nr:hypothetical protein [Candidatus Paceibacterota bacterium]